MKVYHATQDLPTLTRPMVTSGTFDGVHLGHQKILQRLTDLARQEGGESLVLTFWPHPRLVLNPFDTSVKLLSDLDEKIELLEAQGIDHLLILPFTREFSMLDSRSFIQQILIDGIGTHTLVIGYDHRFGRDREGSFDYLKTHSDSLGLRVEEIPKQDVDDLGLSSTIIRRSLLAGDVPNANRCLGRPYSVRGQVVEGSKVGRKIGFPTANIQVFEPHKLIPQDGVYAVRVRHDGQLYDGMLNIGFRPTVQGKAKTMEVHLLDYTADLYGQTLDIQFLAHIRSEQKFESLEALKTQLEHDKRAVQQALGSLT